MIATATRTRPARQDAAPLVVVSSDTYIGPRLVEDPRFHCPADLLETLGGFAGELRQRRTAAAVQGQRVSAGGNNALGDDWGDHLAELDTPGHLDDLNGVKVDERPEHSDSLSIRTFGF